MYQQTQKKTQKEGDDRVKVAFDLDEISKNSVKVASDLYCT